jgi:hypothetical protein
MNRKKYLKIYHKKYNITHKKELLAYRKKHSKKMKEYQKIYRTTHKKSKHKYMILYYLKNKQKIIQQHKQYQVNKRKQNINFRVLDNLRSRLHDAFHGYSKSEKTLNLIGCSVQFLRQYLSSKFTKGMNWKNYGRNGWVIDHIIPCCKFDLTKKSEQYKCFHYKNLQPLWEYDNKIKGTKLLFIKMK